PSSSSPGRCRRVSWPSRWSHTLRRTRLRASFTGPRATPISRRSSAPHGSGTVRIRMDMAISNTRPLHRLFAYSRPYRGRLVWAFGGMLVYAVGSAGLPALIKLIIDKVLPEQQYVMFTAWMIIGLFLLKGIGSYVSSYLMADVGQRVVTDLRSALFRHILGQSAGFFSHGAT